MGQPLTIDLPDDLLQVLGTEDDARREAKTALILDLVRRGKVSRARAAEFLQISLWDLPALLSHYQIPWFDYSAEMLREDLKTVISHTPPPSA
jgi:predicted HTH domain antitoxin